jgi:Tol biopolymer transport system component
MVRGVSQTKINADGSGETRLTHDIPFHGDPADPPIDPTYSPMHSPVWSPGGTKIAFVRGYRFLENPDRYSGDSTLSSLIYVMGSDGSNPTVVKDFSSQQVSNLDWLPGWVDLPLAAPVQAQEERTASGEPPSPTGGCKPVENPVGEIAYQSIEDIWTMNADGSNPSRLTHDQAKEDTPAFSPDGKKIAFVKEVEAEGGSLSETPPHLVPKVVVMDANGCDQVVLPLPEVEYAHEPSWSPDGERIAFVRDDSNASTSIYVMRSDGSDPTLIRDFPPAERPVPDWRPLP